MSEISDDAERAGLGADAIFRRRMSARERRARERFGTVGGVLARVIRPSDSTTAWKVGAEGERLVAAGLQRHLPSGVAVFHDRRIPGRRSNIDHLTVGPGGVTIVDAKHLSGKVRVERGRLRVDGRDRSNLAEGVERQMEAVRETLDMLGLSGVSLIGVLCLARPDGLPLFRDLKIGEIAVVGVRGAAAIAGRPGALGPDAIVAVAQRLDRIFTPTA